jgi:hypothetical protein
MLYYRHGTKKPALEMVSNRDLYKYNIVVDDLGSALTLYGQMNLFHAFL